MKVLCLLALLATTVWLGSEYYKNGKTIAKQNARIEQLEGALAAQKKKQMVPPKPQFRLGGNNSGSSRSNTKQPERRFKRKN